MEWRDDGYILSVRPHGETSAIINVLTRAQGRHAGLVRGGRSRRMRPVLQAGNKVSLHWHARLSDHLGNFEVEPLDAHAAVLMDSRISLGALNAVTGMCMAAIPEREPHPRLYDVFEILLQNLSEPQIWPPLYIRFEVALLQALGYGLDLSSCAATGTSENLTHISPRSGRAVCADAAEPYLDKLMRLPGFMRENTGTARTASATDIADGLAMTAYFLETRVFHAVNKGLPESRLRLVDMLRAEGLI